MYLIRKQMSSISHVRSEKSLTPVVSISYSPSLLGCDPVSDDARRQFAASMRVLMAANHWSQADVARTFSKTRSWVSKLLDPESSQGTTLATLTEIRNTYNKQSPIRLEVTDLFDPDRLAVKLGLKKSSDGLTKSDTPSSYNAPNQPIRGAHGEGDPIDSLQRRVNSSEAVLYDLYMALERHFTGEPGGATDRRGVAAPLSKATRAGDTRRRRRQTAR